MPKLKYSFQLSKIVSCNLQQPFGSVARQMGNKHSLTNSVLCYKQNSYCTRPPVVPLGILKDEMVRFSSHSISPDKREEPNPKYLPTTGKLKFMKKKLTEVHAKILINILQSFGSVGRLIKNLCTRTIRQPLDSLKKEMVRLLSNSISPFTREESNSKDQARRNYSTTPNKKIPGIFWKCKKYLYVVMSVHLVTSVLGLGLFSLISIIFTGHTYFAFKLYNFFKPIRYMTTLAGIFKTLKYLHKFGH